MTDQFVFAEYIWVAGIDTHHDIRSKVRCLPASDFADVDQHAIQKSNDDFDAIAKIAAKFPLWSFDGSSTDQALCCKGKGENTEIYIQPKRVYLHPFPLTTEFGDKKITGKSFVVLCECFFPALPLQPTPCNTRILANKVFEQARDQEPWFAFEQEYVIWDPKINRPYMWPAKSDVFPAPQGPYYCSNGTPAWGRDLAEEHLVACVNAGIRMSGINAEVMPAQWEYQVGPCTGIEAADAGIVSRWLLVRLAAKRGLDINFHAKPVEGDWNGSGMHTNFSTKPMRTKEGGGIQAINDAVAKMAPKHKDDVIMYGEDNAARMTGKHEASDLATFNFGVGMRHVSVRIPVQSADQGCGYFEDRRPSSSADPYLVTGALFASACGLDCSAFNPIRAEKKKHFHF